MERVGDGGPLVEMMLVLPREPRSVGWVRTTVGDALTAVRVAPSFIHDLQLAVGEACANAVEHATASDRYRVSLRLNRVLCIAEVSDNGHVTDVDQLSAAMPGSGSESGRGIPVMRALMDNVEFTIDHAAGTSLTLTRHVFFEPDPLTAGP